MAKSKTNNSLIIICSSLLIICLSLTSYNDNKVWQDEVSLWKTVSTASPLKPRPLTNLGYAHYKDKNYNLAGQYLNKAVQNNPNYYYAYLNLGLLYNDTNRFKEAESVLKKSISLVSNPTAHNALGTVYRKQLNTDSAIAQYKLALALRPNYPEALNNLANAYSIKGDLQNSILAFKKAIKLNPYQDEIINNLGLIYQQNKEYKKAEDSFLMASKINDENFKTYINLGTLYFVEQRYDKAISNYQLALNLNKTYYRAYYNIAVVYERKGMPEEALTYYREAQTNDPSHKIAQKEILRLESLIKR